MSSVYALRTKDATYVATKALPESAAAVVTAGFDLGTGDKLANAELKITVPALTITQMPDGTTLSIAVLDSADGLTYAAQATFPTITAATATTIPLSYIRYAIPSDSKRYIQVQATTGDGTGTAGDCSDDVITAELMV